MKPGANHHISEGQLRTYLDAEMEYPEVEKLRRHLDTCSSCRDRLLEISQRAGMVSQKFIQLSSRVEPADSLASIPQLKKYTSSKEAKYMKNKLFSRNSRLAWASITLLLILAASFAFPQVRAIASNFLGLFRVEKVAVVSFNPANIPDEYSTAGMRIENLLAEEVKVEGGGEPYEVENQSQASTEAGVPIRLPVELGEPTSLMIQPGMKVIFTIDLPRLRLILQELGKEDLKLPDFIHGQNVTASLPTSVIAQYGECQPAAGTAQGSGYDPDIPGSGNPDCTVLIQLASPSINAPPGMDVNQIGAALLELSGMSPEEAERFSQNIDWATTLVVPVPNYAYSKEILVDDAQGVLIQESETQAGQSRYMLIWVKDKVVYALSGQGTAEAALSIANSLN